MHIYIIMSELNTRPVPEQEYEPTKAGKIGSVALFFLLLAMTGGAVYGTYAYIADESIKKQRRDFPAAALGLLSALLIMSTIFVGMWSLSELIWKPEIRSGYRRPSYS